MKAAVLHAFDEKLTAKEFVKYEDVTDPKISRPMDVIVRIGGAGVCRTDLHIVEGIWRSKVDVKLPYIMGHENAGWVEAIGPGVEGVKVGDSVICHPLVTSGHCLACRRGDDMHALDSSFPGINANGGYAQYLLTGQRSLIKLPKSLAPKDVAPYTDAGLTAYRAAKKASRHLLPGEYVAVIGAGGLGHIGIQVLAALCAAEIIVIDRADKSLDLAKECGAHHVVKADGNEVEAVLELTGGRGKDHRRQSGWHLCRTGRADGARGSRPRQSPYQRIQTQPSQRCSARPASWTHPWARRADPVTIQLKDLLPCPGYRTKVIIVNASGRGPQITAEEAAELERARERMLARHKLIEGMIRNNEMQLKNESARGGAEIELECARRDVTQGDAGAGAQAELERATARLQALQEEHQLLVAEREWLNASLLEFESGPSANEHQRSGHS
jgi:NAD+-dependent secondary alcohol dehydrogenase Adh1